MKYLPRQRGAPLGVHQGRLQLDACQHRGFRGADGAAYAPAATCVWKVMLPLLMILLLMQPQFCYAARSLLPVAAAAQATASGFTRAARVSGLRSTDKVVTWAPGTASPGPSRQRLHKKARGLASGRDAAAPQPSDAATA